jgi:heptosyltransferase II
MIRVPNWVGDAVMAEPALRELRRIFSDARITLVARPWVAGLFDGEGLADDLIALDDRKGFAQSAGHFLSNRRRLGRERFDLAVLLQNAMGAALLARLAGVRQIAGYPTDGRRMLLDYIIPLDPHHKTAHQVRYYLNIAARLEQKFTGESRVDVETAEPRLHVSEEAKERALGLLKQSGVIAGSRQWAVGGDISDSAGRSGATRFDNNEPQEQPSLPVACNRLPSVRCPILVINPGATNSRAKQWLAGRFAETADRLAERDGFQTVIVGAASDAAVADEVAAAMRSRPAVLAGRTSISELKGLLACASLVISNDTGTAHVSAALGVPTVVVFGPTEHVSTRPLSQLATVVRKDVDCSPCMLRDCPIDHRCMTRVEVNDVYAAARNLLIGRAG